MVHLYYKIKSWFLDDCINELTSIFNKARAELLFNTVFLVVLIGLPLVIGIFINGHLLIGLQSLLGLFGAFSLLFLLKWFKQLFWPAFLIIFFIHLLIVVGLILNNENLHFKELLWMVNMLVFAIFMLGIRWGLFFFSVFVFSVSYYLKFLLVADIQLLATFSNDQKLFLVVEMGVILLFFIFLISNFVITFRKSEKALVKVNQNLELRNDLVEAQNQEITVLLKEIHHRVKNNLQVINSLLRLQSFQIKDLESKRVFEDAQSRICAISLIHERMYKSPDLSNIKADDYFKDLLDDLFRQNSLNRQVKLEVKVNLKVLPQDIVVPLGLLLNELISNSLEHAKMGEHGVISIQMIQNEQLLKVEYKDNGSGFDSERVAGFGLEMIDTLCEQLGATLNLETFPNKGVNYSIQFQLS